MNLKYINYFSCYYRNISIIQLNNTSKKNSLPYEMLLELKNVIDENEKDDKSKICIIQSLCDNVFSSGHDLSEINYYQKYQPQRLKQIFDECSNVMMSIENSRKIFISEVDGLATAAGLQLATSCHLVISSEHSNFSIPGMHIGLYAATPAVNLLRSLPEKIAFHMLIGSKVFSASEMYKYGLISFLTKERKEKIRNITLQACDEILKNMEESV